MRAMLSEAAALHARELPGESIRVATALAADTSPYASAEPFKLPRALLPG